jgi:TolB protein
MRSRILAVLALTLLSVLAVVAPAYAAFPGTNGKIAFVRYFYVHTINPDGSAETQIERGLDPSWSPDGSKVVFGGGHLTVMNPDGSGRTDLGLNGDWPSWSPDASKILFASLTSCEPDCSTYGLSTINAGGTGKATFPECPPSSCWINGRSSWSPDGSSIAFGADMRDGSPDGVYKFTVGGAGRTFLAPGATPDWSPDGSRIVFSTGSGGIWVINADGTGSRRIDDPQTIGYPGYDLAPVWSPDGRKIAFGFYGQIPSRGPDYVQDIYSTNGWGSRRHG